MTMTKIIILLKIELYKSVLQRDKQLTNALISLKTLIKYRFLIDIDKTQQTYEWEKDELSQDQYVYAANDCLFIILIAERDQEINELMDVEFEKKLKSNIYTIKSTSISQFMKYWNDQVIKSESNARIAYDINLKKDFNDEFVKYNSQYENDLTSLIINFDLTLFKNKERNLYLSKLIVQLINRKLSQIKTYKAFKLNRPPAIPHHNYIYDSKICLFLY